MRFLEGDLFGTYENYDRLVTKSYGSEVAVYLWMVRSYLHVNREADTIVRLLDTFEYYVEKARQTVGCDSFSKQKPQSIITEIEPSDFSNGARDVLLLHTIGKLTAVPAMRSAVELGIHRNFLSQVSFLGTKVDPDEIRFSEITNACQWLGTELTPSTDSIDRMYVWASKSVHLGATYDTEELWFAYLLGTEFLQKPIASFKRPIQEFVDYLSVRQRNRSRVTKFKIWAKRKLGADPFAGTRANK
jgi:hypothetical protein